jgi:tRNA splicing endonuclease
MIKFERKPRARKWKFDPFPKDIKAIGIFTGADVEIFNEQDCRSLFENGAFGLNPKPRQILMFNQQQNMKILSDNEYMRKLEFKNKFGTEEDDELIQLENGEVHPDPFKIPNSLVLSLEEAFFLHKILNCLEIRDIEDKILSTSGIWTKFCRLKENFVECFIAYLFLKSKNWVIKSGVKFGGDFRKFQLNLVEI